MQKAAFLLLLLAVSLLSCLHGGSNLKATESGSFRGIVLHGSWEDTNRYTRFFNAVTENHPDLDFDIEFQDSTDARDRITVLLAAGHIPDFVLNWHYIDDDLTDGIKKRGLYRTPRLPEDYYHGLIGEAHPFVIPLGAAPYGLIYNEERLQRAEIDPAEIESWADLLAAFSQYRHVTQEYPLILPQNPEQPWMWFLFFGANLAPVLGPQGSSRIIQDLRRETLSLNNPYCAEVIRRIAQVRVFAHPELSRLDFQNIFDGLEVDGMEHGEAAFMFGYPFVRISASDSKVLGLAPVPGLGESAYFSAYPQHTILFFDTANTAHQGRLDRLMEALLEENTLPFLYQSGTTYPTYPPRSSLLLEGSPFYKRVQTVIAERGELLSAINQYQLFQASDAREDLPAPVDSANVLFNELAGGELDPYSCLLEIDILFMGTAEPGSKALQAAVSPGFFEETFEMDMPESQKGHDKIILQDTDQPRLVILDFKTDGAVNSLQAAACGDAVAGELQKDSRFQVIDRGLRDAFLKQEAFTLSDCHDDPCLLQAGRLLRADLLVAGRIQRSGERIAILLQLIEVGSGERRESASRTIDELTDLIPSFKELALEIFQH